MLKDIGSKISDIALSKPIIEEDNDLKQLKIEIDIGKGLLKQTISLNTPCIVMLSKKSNNFYIIPISPSSFDEGDSFYGFYQDG